MSEPPDAQYLKYWLYCVAGLRMLSVYLGFRDAGYFRTFLFSKMPKMVTELYGRTFATWTTVTCALCVFCAQNLSSRPIYQATIFSFLAAIAHFTSELFVFKTMSLRNALSPCIVAGVSTAWMLWGLKRYTKA